MTKAAAGVITHEAYRRTSPLFWRHTTSTRRHHDRRRHQPASGFRQLRTRFPAATSAGLPSFRQGRIILRARSQAHMSGCRSRRSCTGLGKGRVSWIGLHAPRRPARPRPRWFCRCPVRRCSRAPATTPATGRLRGTPCPGARETLDSGRPRPPGTERAATL